MDGSELCLEAIMCHLLGKENGNAQIVGCDMRSLGSWRLIVQLKEKDDSMVRTFVIHQASVKEVVMDAVE